MGHIHSQHGRIAIETRRDYGFIIHAGYGFSVGTEQIGDLKPGTIFVARDPRVPSEPDGIGLPNDPPPKRVWRLSALFEDRAEATEEQSSSIASFPLHEKVEIPGMESFDSDAPLAQTWNGIVGAHPHPEFLREDLDDLIEALIEVRDVDA